MAEAAARLIVTGRVQGVGYRWWAIGEARRRTLRGWVRNRADGSVEMLAIGEEAALEAFSEACRSGPAAAQVASVEGAEAQDDGSEGFQERR
ncbi:MAG: acylphosphatase [Caulobacteraceae bacterium]